MCVTVSRLTQHFLLISLTKRYTMPHTMIVLNEWFGYLDYARENTNTKQWFKLRLTRFLAMGVSTPGRVLKMSHLRSVFVTDSTVLIRSRRNEVLNRYLSYMFSALTASTMTSRSSHGTRVRGKPSYDRQISHMWWELNSYIGILPSPSNWLVRLFIPHHCTLMCL